MKKGISSKRKRRIIAGICAMILAMPFCINGYMIHITQGRIVKTLTDQESFTQQEIEALRGLNTECILVLGAGLKADGTPNHMLKDRLETGLALYRAKVAPKLLLTGDHGQEEYDEVNAMKTYMVDHGVPEEDLFLDHAGFSTYESMYRAGFIFDVERMLVVTQTYHQYRALYMAEGFGMEAYGISADQWTYAGQAMRDFREILARNKDFFKMIVKPKPTYLGDTIPISGSGFESWD